MSDNDNTGILNDLGTDPGTNDPGMSDPGTNDPGTDPGTNDAGTSANAYQSIIDQQQEQINALLKQTEALNAQIVGMVQNGAQFNDGNQGNANAGSQGLNPTSLADMTGASLSDLASEIGKR